MSGVDDDRPPLLANDPGSAVAPPPPSEPAPASSIGLALGAGLVAALAAGIAWGLIVKWSNYEIGIAAWAIGFLVGWAVHLAAGRRLRPELAAIAVVAALLGILLGKYLTFVFVARDEAKTLGITVPVVSRATWRLFWESKSDVFSFFDLLWAALAVVTAARVASGTHSTTRRTAI